MLDPLTERQVDVLKLMAQGMTDNEIGDSLGISPRTVRTHTNQMYSKLGVRNRTEAVLAAQRLGIVEDARDDEQ